MVDEARINSLKTEIQKLDIQTEYVLLRKRRYELLTVYRQTIFLEPLESSCRALEVEMWRSCFHLPIDTLRRLISVGGDKDTSIYQSEMHHIINMGMATLPFIMASLIPLSPSGAQKLNDFSHTLSDIFVIENSINFFDKKNENKITKCPAIDGSIYRLCIFIGDLMRYRATVSRSFDPSRSPENIGLKMAQRVYKDCCVLWSPENGHAYSQLAIVETLLGRRIEIIYWYCRAWDGSCLKPFGLAQVNLEKYLNNSHQASPQDFFFNFFNDLLHGKKLPPQEVISKFIKWIDRLTLREITLICLTLLSFRNHLGNCVGSFDEVILVPILWKSMDKNFNQKSDDFLLLSMAAISMHVQDQKLTAALIYEVCKLEIDICTDNWLKEMLGFLLVQNLHGIILNQNAVSISQTGLVAILSQTLESSPVDQIIFSGLSSG